MTDRQGRFTLEAGHPRPHICWHQGISPNSVETPLLTTIVSVRRNGKVVMGGDGQVSLGNTVMKGNAKKVRRL